MSRAEEKIFLDEQINKLAVKIKKTNQGEVYETLRVKLIENCLRCVLKCGLEDDLSAKIRQPRKKFEAEFDGVVFVNVFEYSLKEYTPDRGNFVNFFVHVYCLRAKVAQNKELAEQNMPGIKQIYTDTEKRMMRDIGKYMGRGFSDLTKEELSFACHELLLPEATMMSLHHRYNSIAISLDQERDDDHTGTIQVKDCRRSDAEAEENLEYIRQIFEHVLAGATVKQKPLFRAFLTIDIFNEYGGNVPKYLDDLPDKSLILFRGGQELKDVTLVEYLQMDKSNISKYRKKYREAVEVIKREQEVSY